MISFLVQKFGNLNPLELSTYWKISLRKCTNATLLIIKLDFAAAMFNLVVWFWSCTSVNVVYCILKCDVCRSSLAEFLCCHLLDHGGVQPQSSTLVNPHIWLSFLCTLILLNIFIIFITLPYRMCVKDFQSVNKELKITHWEENSWIIQSCTTRNVRRTVKRWYVHKICPAVGNFNKYFLTLIFLAKE